MRELQGGGAANLGSRIKRLRQVQLRGRVMRFLCCLIACHDASQVLPELQKFREMIFDDPAVDLESRIKRLRQANFKQEYKVRQALRAKFT
jgi:hypothetical protein